MKRLVLFSPIAALALLSACWTSGASGSGDVDPGTDTDADTDIDSDTDVDTDTDSECVPEQYQQCGADGNVHWFDSCDVEGALVEECPPENMECVHTSETTAECQCLPSHSGPECEEVCVRYVDSAADFYGDGLSWATALADLLAGIDAAEAAATSDSEFEACEVWVVQGTYYAYETDRDDSFKLLDGALVFGGFVGSETARNQRDWQANETVLDGRGGPDGDVRVYHVVTATGDGVLDGFTITGGSAEGNSDEGHNCGGGMTIKGDGAPEIANCTFTGNFGVVAGGIDVGDSSQPEIRGCRFVGNQSSVCSTAINVNGGSQATIANCFFHDNWAEVEIPGDGGMAVGVHEDAAAAIVNSTFTAGCCHAVSNAVLIITNSVLGDEGSVGADEDSPSLDITYSLIEGEYAAGEGNIGLFDWDSIFVDADNGDFHLPAGSPCIDAAEGDSAPAHDIEGNPRVDDSDTPNTGIGPPWADMGAYEFQP